MEEEEINEEDLEIILSPLCFTYTEEDRAVDVEIYKGSEDKQWFLEVLDGNGNSFLFDGQFDTDELALQQFKEDVKKEGIEAFIKEPDLGEPVTQYKASQAPDREAWLSTDETELISLVEDYHNTLKDADGDHYEEDQVEHALFHLIVENQIAEGEIVVIKTVEKLMRQGLSRHESIHAVAAILCDDLYDLMQGNGDFDLKKYRRRLEKLTAKRWRKGQY